MTQFINRDRLNNLNPDDVIQASLKQISETQYEKPEIQSTAFAVTLMAFCRRHHVDVGDAFTIANNILHSKCGQSNHYRALADYMKHEL